jgi:hypothetical protein
MSADCAIASAFTRVFTRGRSTVTTPGALSGPVNEMPSSAASSISAISSAVAISVFEGTQSVITADPPTPSLSITVTSAPSWAATSADS